ncbi:MAG: Sugar transporter ATP-binding protein [Aeromicrobium sp.]|nr:Sugar transporter ATP-binding protein [Aeromicrobium sp.]
MTDQSTQVQAGRVDVPARLELRSVRRSFGAIQAVSDATLSIRAGEIHALCGHNGAGKSTVVKMICGLLEPGGGEILLDGEPVSLHSTHDAQRLGIALVDQELSVIPHLTVAENLMLGSVGEPTFLRRSTIRRRAGELLARVGLTCSPDTLLEHLSIGERQLVEIARALSRGARVLLLDEPTATLSSAEIELVFDAVRATAAEGCAVIFVSHRLGEVIELCDRVTVMRDGRTVAESSTSGMHPNEIVHQMLGALPEKVAKAPLGAAPVMLRLRELAVPGVFQDVSLDISAGRIYALAGQVGSGASEVLRSVAGLYPSSTGAIDLDDRPVPQGRPGAAQRRGIAFASGDRKSEGLFLTKDVRTNLVVTRLPSVSTAGVVRRGRVRRESTDVAQVAGIDPSRLHTPVEQLSGGNQQKVLVGRSLADDRVKVLLLDEPTRGVDVGGRGAIHQTLRAAANDGMAVIFASTELDELIELADTVVTMREGRIVSIYEGSATEAAVLNDITHAEGIT